MQLWIVGAAVLGLIGVAWAGAEAGGAHLAAAVMIGGLGGFALRHAAFGFAGSWRRLTRERRGAGVRAQLQLLAIVVITAYPLIGYQQALGLDLNPWVFPMGLASAFGAAMFGFGMQLGGGCGSGALFTVGGGSTRMVVTLLAFIAGSVVWSLDPTLWRGAPNLGRVSLITEIGAPAALVFNLAAIGALHALVARVEQARHGAVKHERGRGFEFGARAVSRNALMRGPWPLWLGAAVLAAVVILTFLALGRPWGVTAAYPFWGAKMLDALGAPIREVAYWRGDALDRPLFGDATGVMNFGVMLGAFAAAGLAGSFAPRARLSRRDVATAIIGGLLMGYGARLAYGCNIGGLIGGVASASLHGWWWLIFGWVGSMAGVWARGRIGMDPPLDVSPRFSQTKASD